jgi:hypothetical protein
MKGRRLGSQMTRISVWICLGREGVVVWKVEEEGLGVLRSYDGDLIETSKEIFLPHCVHCYCFKLTKPRLGVTCPCLAESSSTVSWLSEWSSVDSCLSSAFVLGT